jgi:hypothetical protein
MKRTQLQHVLRAAASIVELSDLVVIGSQAILASYPEWELPPGATMSVEADLAVDATLARVDLAVDESTLADRIDGAIGEGSMFHQTHGYYAQGVETTTAVLTEGWRDRLIPFVCEDADPKVVGWCLERHDLWTAKAAAGREKDRDFCLALAGVGLVEAEVCRERIEQLDDHHRQRALAVAAAAFPA